MDHPSIGSDGCYLPEAVFRQPAALQVAECHNVTGTVEYLLRVKVADIAAYKTFHKEVPDTLDPVRSQTSYIVLGSPKDERA